VVAWTLWARSHSTPSGDLVLLYYTNYLGYQFHSVSWGDVPTLLSRNVAYLFASITQMLTSQVGDFYWRLFAIAAVAGAVRLARRNGLTPYCVFAICMAPLFVLWLPEARYVFPLFPLLAAGLWCEMHHAIGLVRTSFQRGSRIPAAVLGGFLAVSGALAVFHLGRTLFGYLPRTFRERREVVAAQRDAYQWVSRQSSPDARFVAYDDMLFYLHTGRPALSVRAAPKLYYGEQFDELVRLHSDVGELAHKHGARYLFATKDDYYRGEVPARVRDRTRHAIEALYRDRLVFRSGPVSVYEVREEGTVPMARSLP